MSRTSVRSEQVRDQNILVDDLRDFGVFATSGLNVAVKAGRIRNDNVITDQAEQPLAMSNNTTNYVELNTSGVASSNTTGFTAGRVPLATVVTSGGAVTTITDKRSWVIVDNNSGGSGTPPGTLSSTTKDLWIALARTKIVEDQTANRSANEVWSMRTDVFTDGSGIDSGLSVDYTLRGTPNYDIIALPPGIGLFRPADIPTGLQGNWKLDEASGTRQDSSSNNNDLTDNNTVASVAQDYWRTGENSADFEQGNSEYLSITDAAQTGLDMTGSYSISAFIKKESGTDNGAIVFKWTGSAGYFFYVSDAEQLVMGQTGNTLASATDVIKVGKWHHVACVYDGAFMSIYLDGNLITTQVYTTAPGATSANFVIGRRDNDAQLYFDGLIKDTAIWNTALTPLQIKSLALGVNLTDFTYRPDSIGTAPTSYWKLNEISSGAGAITRSDSVGSNHLTDTNTCTTGAGYIEGAGIDMESSNTEYLSGGTSMFNLTGNNWSIVGWFRPEATTGAQTLVAKYDATSTGLLVTQGGGVYINNSAVGGISFSPSPVANAWHHFALTFNSGTLKIYLDGVETGSATSVPNIITNSADFRIGYRADNPGGATFAFDGLMSDWAIWSSTTISAANIASLASGLPLQQQGLISHWKLNETSGNRADSVSSNTLTDNNTVGQGTGKVGNAADFEADNTEYLTLSSAGDFACPTDEEWTFGVWMNFETHASEMYLLNLADSVNNLSISKQTTGGGRWDLALGGATFSTTIPTTTGAWEYVIITKRGTTWELHIQGSLRNSQAQSGAITASGTLNIGRTNAGSLYYDGLLDEMFLMERGLREEEIKTLYNKGLNGKEITSSEISVGGGTAVVISTAFTVSETPDRALLVVNKVTGTGSLAFYVSRVSSPGTNLADTTKWTPITENTITDISGQTSGTSCRWAVEIDGDSELDDIAVVFGKIGGSSGGSGSNGADLGLLFSLMGA